MICTDCKVDGGFSSEVIMVLHLTYLSTFLIVENTQKVAKNLDYRIKGASAELSKSHVDVLVPEVLQVVIPTRKTTE